MKHGAKAATEYSTVEPMAIHMHNMLYIYTNHCPPPRILFANCYKHALTLAIAFSEIWQEYPYILRVDHNLTKCGKLAKILVTQLVLNDSFVE